MQQGRIWHLSNIEFYVNFCKTTQLQTKLQSEVSNFIFMKN